MKDLRLTFDEDPEVYDRIRPSYPDALFEDLWAIAGLRSGSRVCELGAGTGKATASLLDRGARVTAIEIGRGLASFLRTKFAASPNLAVVEAPFETAELAPGSYDAVLAATAWHWLDPAVRLERSAALLRDPGVLAVIDTIQVESNVDGGYFAASQAIYRKYGQDDDTPTPAPDDVFPDALPELQISQLFEPPTLFRYRWDQTYSRADYQDLMRSYSNMRAMAPREREALIGELGAFIDARYNGFVTRPLVVTLTVARKS